MQIFSPMLSSRILIVLHFTLRSVIHFELFFVTGVRSMSGSFFFSVCGCQWFQHHLKGLLKIFAVAPFSFVSGQSTVSHVGLFLGSLFH